MAKEKDARENQEEKKKEEEPEEKLLCAFLKNGLVAFLKKTIEKDWKIIK